MLKPGGWHFSFLMTPEQVQEKYKSWAHTELNQPLYTDIDYIKKRIAEGKRIHDDDSVIFYEEIDRNFPLEIFENQDKYREFIHTPTKASIEQDKTIQETRSTIIPKREGSDIDEAINSEDFELSVTEL